MENKISISEGKKATNKSTIGATDSTLSGNNPLAKPLHPLPSKAPPSQPPPPPPLPLSVSASKISLTGSSPAPISTQSNSLYIANTTTSPPPPPPPLPPPNFFVKTETKSIEKNSVQSIKPKGKKEEKN
jgi:hypothetical protein